MPRTRRLLLELDEGAVPLTGLIGPLGAQGRPFVGYTQLLAALETLTAAALVPGSGASSARSGGAVAADAGAPAPHGTGHGCAATRLPPFSIQTPEGSQT